MWRLPIPRFKVLVFGANLPASGLRSYAHFEPGILVIQGKERTFTVQASRINLKTGGYDGRQWLISWHTPAGPMTAMLQGEEAVDAFIRAAPNEIGQTLHRVRITHTRGIWRFRAGMLLLAVVIGIPLLVLSLFWLFADELSQWTADRIDIAQEIRLGEQAFEQIRPGLKLIEHGIAHDALELTGVRLTAGLDQYRYRFHLANAPEVNAFALPGGQVVVFTGLLQAVGDADELAGVLAHEISHVELHHTLRHMIHDLGWRALLAAALGRMGDGFWGNLAGTLGQLHYGRDQELAADQEGVRLLQRTGLPAAGIVRFLERSARQGPMSFPLLATHPGDLERRTALSERVAGLGYYPSRPLAIDWNEVKIDLEKR